MDEKEITIVLLSKFFPLLSSYPELDPIVLLPTVQMPAITKEDIWLAIFSASLYSVWDIDDILSIVWQKL